MARWTVSKLGERRLTAVARARTVAGILETAALCQDDALRSEAREALNEEGAAAPEDRPSNLVLKAEEALLKANADGFARHDHAGLEVSLLDEVEHLFETLPPVVSSSTPLPSRIETRTMVAGASLLNRARSLPEGGGRLTTSLRIAEWLVDRFEVSGRLEPDYPRTKGVVRVAPIDALSAASRLWIDLFEATGDGWYLNSALNLIDIIGSAQYRGWLDSALFGALPSRLPARPNDGGPASGDPSATAAFASVLVAEQRALARHAGRSWTTAGQEAPR